MGDQELTDSNHARFMRMAIAMARQSAIVDRTGSPFGCVIIREGEIVGAGVNRVPTDNDPTAHAEVVAIREACRNLGTYVLDGCTMYATGEPCPMCYAAAWWARVEAIYYASTIRDALDYGDFDDMGIYHAVSLSGPDRALPARELLRDEMVAVWQEFHAIPNRIHY
jgi:tRNA(Arg) A34 adenosine deaminase TadA